MPEVIIGPRATEPWPKRPPKSGSKAEQDHFRAAAAAVLANTGSWGPIERARNKAIEWMDEQLRAAYKELISGARSAGASSPATPQGLALMFAMRSLTATQLPGKMHHEGLTVGVTSGEHDPVPTKFRLDYDPVKGPHYNVDIVREGRSACFRFDAPPGIKGPGAWVERIMARWSRR